MLQLRGSHQATLDTERQALFAVLTPDQRTLAEQHLLTGPNAGRGARMYGPTG